MPIYEYRCENGHTFDAIQRMADDALTECEVCGAPCQRVLHAPAVHFKGSGFYNTDYGTKKRARELKSAGEGKSGSNGGDGTSSGSSTSTSTSSSDSTSGDSRSTSSTSSSSSSSSSGDSAPKSAAS
ncbi:FmdB family zinc ribbon protein [Conexibacter sp. JD483]|uniref:FmdB family zinc ribbon protein n=1 Tax=unclassified Conexibacter TaxID=2627773 RepID=UPI0027156C89|nr:MULTISPECIES: FmdB family zinc ribbon protein [unclassified Conexibacter]MDO8185905.1 zinc ribbon domain-containing protein [Conexibacter sp. CPCC 205706]MDO8199396.1 zinc ribbon domain-containing protein [Conexibacter sp. CPCC 205762]MDR9371296.1 FmdB family zinc ribbon protein [Conexibacter sp. JD483]